MEGQIPTKNQYSRKINNLDEQERALLSIILMNNGKIKGTRLKRIFLEKYSLWDLQNTQNKLKKKGLLDKNVGELGAESSVYIIPQKFHSILGAALSSQTDYPTNFMQNDGMPTSCCQELSILWYLMEVDSVLGYGLIGSNTQKMKRLVSKRVEDFLGITEVDSRFIIHLIKDLSNNEFFLKNRINKWADILDSPYIIVKKIYRLIYYDISENSNIGRGDVGKDNVDFLIDEIAALNTENWYLLESFVSNAKTTLYSANQPDRWIHFSEENIWKILNNEFRLIEVVHTFEGPSNKKYFKPSVLGDYCFDGMSHEEFRKAMDLRRGQFLVHPNFEVTLISKEVNPEVIWELTMFSSSMKVDTVSVFKISRESVELGIKRGLSTQRMIGFLEENSKGKVPQNVEYSISDWAV
jgi:hypothetical protein